MILPALDLLRPMLQPAGTSNGPLPSAPSSASKDVSAERNRAPNKAAKINWLMIDYDQMTVLQK